MDDFDDLKNLDSAGIDAGDIFKRFLNKQNEQGQPEKKIDDALQAAKEDDKKIGDLTAPSAFGDALTAAKLGALSEAAAIDENFKKEFSEEIKKAAKVSAQKEKEKETLDKQHIEAEQEKLTTEQLKNEYQQKVDKWSNKQKKREFAYQGLQPILESVGVQKPLFIPLMYLLTLLILPIFLLGKLFRVSVGNLITGVNSEDRSKGVKGLYWTFLGFLALCAIGFIIILILNLFGAVHLLW